MGDLVELLLLGEVTVKRGERPIKGFVSGKELALFAYLAYTQQSHPREVLADLLWDECSQVQAQSNLRTLLSRLRRLLGSHLIITRESVAFDLESEHWVDAFAFLSQLDDVYRDPSISSGFSRCWGAKLEKALSLYRGEFLNGVRLRKAERFEKWMTIERARLQQRAINGFRDLVMFYLRRGRYQLGIERVFQLLALDPFDEQANRLLMILLVLNGQRNAALTHFMTYSQTLTEELRIPPEKETIELYEAIKAERYEDITPWGRLLLSESELRLQPSAKYPQNNLPLRTTSFIGRRSELAQLCELLLDPDFRLVTLVGEGGVGKTRLALEAARRVMKDFLHGAWFVSLEVEPNDQRLRSPDQIRQLLMSAVAEALQLSFHGKEGLDVQLLSYLREKELLLLIDNFESFVAGTDCLLEVLHHAPEVTVLVTSREPLNCQAEVILRLKGLPTVDLGGEHPIEVCNSVQLFVDRATRWTPDFVLTEANLPAVLQVCQLTEGLPLAIELAATWMSKQTPTEIAQAIQKNLDVLSTTQQDVPERHRSMRAVFEGSWRLLSPIERLVLSCAYIFRGGFTSEAALAVINDQLFEAQGEQIYYSINTSKYLFSLADKCLLGRSATGRFAMHELLRQFVGEKVEDTAMVQSLIDLALRQHSGYYLEFVARKGALLKGRESRGALAEIWEEIENIRRAWRWAVNHGELDAIRRGLNGLVIFYQITGLYREGESLLGMATEYLRTETGAMEGSERKANILLAQLLAEQAHLSNEQGKYEQAIALAQEAVELSQAENSERAEMLALLQWGWALRYWGESASAREKLNRALAFAREQNTRGVEADALLHLGNVCLSESDFGAASEHHKQALYLYRQIGDRQGEALTLNSLGLGCWNRGKYNQAQDFYNDAQDILRELGNRRVEAMVLNNLGLVFWNQGDYANAEIHFDQALYIFGEIGDRMGVGLAMSNLGLIHQDQCNNAVAKEYFEKALNIRREIGDRQGEGNSLNNIGLCHLYLGDYAKAMACFIETLRLRQEIGDRRGIASTFNNLGLAHMQLGAYERAKAYLEQALSLWLEVGDQQGEGLTLANLGLLYHSLGKNDGALRYLQQSLEIAESLNDRSTEANALTNLGHVLTSLGDFEQADITYHKALRLRQNIGQPTLAQELLAGLARLHLTRGDLTQASAFVEDILSHPKVDNIEGLDEPFLIFLICYRVLRANNDPRAQGILEKAHNLLQERAASITDGALRRSYLENVVAHREILAAWNANRL